MGAWYMCGLLGDEVRTSTNGLSFIYTSCKKAPSASPLNQRAVGEERVAEHLAQFTGEGEQGHVSPHTGAP